MPQPEIDRRKASRRGLHLVACFEAAKGVLVLLVGCGLLAFIHKDLHHAAEQLVRVLHMNPAHHYPSILIDAADKVTDLQLWVLAFSAVVYSTIRLVEAYGLWKGYQWAEWFGFLSGAIYIPMELFEVARQVTWPRVTVLAINLIIVGYLAFTLIRTGRHRRRVQD